MNEHLIVMKEENLIVGYLQGRLSKVETDLFYSWIHADAENKKLFFEAKAIYDACLISGQSMDINKSWQCLLAKWKQTHSPTYIIWRRIASYAAVAVIAILLTSTLFMLLPDKMETRVATHYIGGDGLEADVVILPDGTRVSLGSKTGFHYSTDYGKTTRTVYLEGEAYFEVAKQKDIPFIVKVNGQDIEALGTKFNVMAYPADSIFTTTLLEGAVRLITGKSQSVPLKPNQQLVYNRNKGFTKVNSVDAKQFIAWTSGYYFFPEQRLEAILHRLGHVYGAQFTVRSEKLNKTVFTGTFYRGQSIKDILEIVNMSIPIKYKIDDHRVIISE
jgi:ferric-dicitrate binding protein FerR (iron transport regulator)